jgi:hypothetical protein
MQKNLLRLFSVLLVLLLSGFINNTYATTPVVHTAPKPTWISPCKPYTQKPPDRNIEDGAYNELIEEQINVETHAIYNHFITQIVSQTGVQNNSELSVSFNPAYERLDFHSITVWRNGKPQNRLNINSFKILADESEFDRFIYNGTYAAKYILADIRKGDKIEYAYTITGANPIFNNKFARSIYFQGYSIIAHQYTTLLVSSARKLNMNPINANPKMVTSNLAGGLKRYEWESFQVKPLRSSNNRQPSWYNEFQRVQVSDYANWAEVVTWALSINPITSTFNGELAAAITKLKLQAGADKEKYFRSAVKLVQDEVRYMGIETGEYSHRANDPGKVFKQRYGDCKDKSLLLASILQAGGIEAHMALISTGLKDKLDNFIPSAGLFNHAVVVATLNGNQIWVDATIANQRGTGLNIYFPNYSRGLILKAGNNALTKIPLSPAGKIICNETYTVHNEKDSAALEVKTKYTLNQADDIRDRLASSGTAETEKTYLDYYSKIYPSIELKDSLTVIDDEQKNVLTTIEHYNIGKYLKRDSSDGLYHGDFYANSINEQLPKLNGQIKSPVAVNYPYDMDYTVKLIFPLPWNIEDKKDKIVRDDYEYYFNLAATGDTLNLHYRFAYLHNFIPAAKVSEFMQDVKELSNQKLAFNFNYTPAGVVAHSDTNVIMVLFAIIFVIAIIFICIKIYRTPTSSIRVHGYSYGQTIGGWLILPIIGLIFTPLSLFNYILNAHFFKLATWNAYNTSSKVILFKLLIIFETGGNLITFCFPVFCLILIFKKRDIAPRYITAFYLSCLLFVVLDYFWALCISINSTSAPTQIARALVVVAVWVPYFRISTRVKETFIEPYPKHNIIWHNEEGEEITDFNDDTNTQPAAPKTIEGKQWDGV